MCCIDSVVMLNYIDIKSYIIGQLRSDGGDVYRVKQEMMLSRTWNFVLFCLAVTYYRANTNSPGPGVMKREEKLQRH